MCQKLESCHSCYSKKKLDKLKNWWLFLNPSQISIFKENCHLKVWLADSFIATTQCLFTRGRSCQSDKPVETLKCAFGEILVVEWRAWVWENQSGSPHVHGLTSKHQVLTVESQTGPLETFWVAVVGGNHCEIHSGTTPQGKSVHQKLIQAGKDHFSL